MPAAQVLTGEGGKAGRQARAAFEQSNTVDGGWTTF